MVLTGAKRVVAPRARRDRRTHNGVRTVELSCLTRIRNAGTLVCGMITESKRLQMPHTSVRLVGFVRCANSSWRRRGICMISARRAFDVDNDLIVRPDAGCARCAILQLPTRLPQLILAMLLQTLLHSGDAVPGHPPPDLNVLGPNWLRNATISATQLTGRQISEPNR